MNTFIKQHDIVITSTCKLSYSAVSSHVESDGRASALQSSSRKYTINTLKAIKKKSIISYETTGAYILLSFTMYAHGFDQLQDKASQEKDEREDPGPLINQLVLVLTPHLVKQVQICLLLLYIQYLHTYYI